jgi:hypothetical protein
MHNDATSRGELVDGFRLTTLDSTELCTNALRRLGQAREQQARQATACNDR